MDWSLVRSFLAVAECGSLSAAARSLRLSQPTLGRHIEQLETAFGVGLFDRSATGMTLTARGQDLLESARAMATAADGFARRATGASDRIAGVVRISANEVMGITVLPAALAVLAENHPGIEVELVISNAAASLSRREADVALRMFRPTQPDLVARRLPDLPIGLYAHQSYLDRHGRPTLADLAAHVAIGYDTQTAALAVVQALGLDMTAKDFRMRSDSLLAQQAMVRAGVGIGALHVGLAALDPDLVPVLPEVAIPPLELWLVCHRDISHNRRIRVVMDHLAAWLATDPYRGAGEIGPHCPSSPQS